MRNNHEDGYFRNSVFITPPKGFVGVQTITGNVVLTDNSPPMLVFDATATDRNITLPAALGGNLSRSYFIRNASATANLTIKDPTGAVTINVIPPGGAMNVSSFGTSWYGYAASNGTLKQTLIMPLTLPGMVNSAVHKLKVPFAFRLDAVGWRTATVAAAASKAATLTAGITGVTCTGGVISLTTANNTASGVRTAGTAITALNVGAAGGTIEMTVSAVTAFTEGDGWVEADVTALGGA